MTDVMNEGALIRTGIEGLDEILLGGIPRENLIVVQGETGTGKTLFGTEFIYRGIVEFDEPGMIVVFETSAQKLIRDAAAMGWDLEELQTRKKLQIVFTSPEVLEQEVRSPDSLLLETAAEIGAQRIFIDGIGLLSQSSARRRATADGETSLLSRITAAAHRSIEPREPDRPTLARDRKLHRGAIDSGSRRLSGRYRDQAGRENPRRPRSSLP